MTVWTVFVNRKRSSSSSSSRSRSSRPSTVPTLGTITTLAMAVAFARSITVDAFVATVRAIYATFPPVRHGGGPVGVPTRHVGRLTNRRVVDFQNTTLVDNATWQLADHQLLIVWLIEHPCAVGSLYTDIDNPRGMVGMVASIRHQLNGGKHGPAPIPATPLVAYGGVTGRSFPARTVAPVAPVAPVKPAKPATTPRLRKRA